MCGVTGIYNPHGLSDNFRDKELFKKMVLSMRHRGPDEQGVLYSDTGYLGTARLSIIDIETNGQPIHSKKYNMAVVCNGEIFNYEELRRELKEKNYHFNTAGDIEPLIYLYREYGRKMLDKLNGQFAFAIADFENNKIFMARDRIGIRPLFYTFSGETLLFASCIKTLAMRPEVAVEFNYRAYNQLVSLWTPYGETTFFKNIYSVKPGEFIEYSKKGIDKKIYWDMSFDNEPPDLSLSEWKEKIYGALTEATKLRLKADVPVNAYLSGGLDSSIILRLAKDNHTGGLESFSVRFDDKEFDETDYQRLMSEYTEIKNNDAVISFKDIGEVFEKVIRHSEQPVFRTAPAPLYHLSKLVNKKGFKVVLTGEGADEIAWGYNIFKETFIRRNLATNPDDSQWTSMIPALYPYLKQFDKKYLHFLAAFYKKAAADVDSPLFSHSMRISNGRNLLNFVTPNIREELSKFDINEDIIPTLPDSFTKWTPLQKTQYLEMKTMLAGYLLASQGDRMSMSHSVEGRHPFLDHNVIELFAKIPDRLKLNLMNEKYILKETFKKVLPDSITQRNKYPYRAPEAVSLMGDDLLNSYINESAITDQNFFNWKMVKRLIDKLKQKKVGVGFNDNFAYVNIVGSSMFLNMSKRFANPDFSDELSNINEINIDS